ncbi:hypothetical protein GIV81_14305, partial [Pseudomonas syringae]|nr:hypothetical protein [Pseudomonas syringae]
MSFDLRTRLDARRAEHLYRQRPLLQSPQGPQVIVDGQLLLAFCNNDYMGLASHPDVIAAWPFSYPHLRAHETLRGTS